MMKIEIDNVEEVIEKVVKVYGSNGVVHIPKKHENKRVKVVVLNEKI